MTDRELMQMALDAMESFEGGTNGLYKGEFAEERKALRDRLAWPEPVLENPKFWVSTGMGHKRPLHVAPPKKEWVGLTDIEIIDISKATSVYGPDNHYEVLEFVASIEAKLKEKNS